MNVQSADLSQLYQVMQNAQSAQIDFTKKVLKANMEIALSQTANPNIGQNIDFTA